MSLQTLVAVGESGVLTTSPDGITWTSRTSGFGTGRIRGVAWSPELNLFAAVGESGVLTTSPDGITWTSRTSGFGSTTIRGVAWSPELDLFAAVGESGKLTTSPDGITWTSRTSGFGTTTIYGVAWSPELTLFVAVGESGKLTTSPDGITWTSRTSGFGTIPIYGVAWSPELTLFVAVGDSGKLTTSPDGISWTSRTSGFGTGRIRGVAWSPELDLFVAVGDSGKLRTSPDGITWTSRTSGFGTGRIRGVAWSPELNLFAAVGESGVLTTSPDGISWTSRTSGFGTARIFGVASINVQNSPPNEPILDSPVGTTIDLDVTNRFDWTFSDPDTGDTQSEFQFQARIQGTESWTVDVTTETPTTHYDVPGGTFSAADWEWRVRTKDAAGEQGPFSSPASFTAATPPAGPTITAPTVDATIATEDFLVEWSASEQDAYQLRRVADAAGSPDTDDVLFDTGQVNSSGARSRTVNFPTNDQIEHVQVRALRNSLWSPYSTARVDVSYTVPLTPTAVVTADTPAGAVTVSATNPTPDGTPDVESFRVFRRKVGDTSVGIRLAINVAPSGSFVDYSVPSGVDVEYRVQAMGDNGTSVLSAWQS